MGQIHCPVLAFYGTPDEVGGPAGLLLIRRQARVDLQVIKGSIMTIWSGRRRLAR
jgi:hypothetical protein